MAVETASLARRENRLLLTPAVDLRCSASARTLKEKKENEGETSNRDTCEQSRDEVQGVMHR
jgi:hypothetical protein